MIFYRYVLSMDISKEDIIFLRGTIRTIAENLPQIHVLSIQKLMISGHCRRERKRSYEKLKHQAFAAIFLKLNSK